MCIEACDKGSLEHKKPEEDEHFTRMQRGQTRFIIYYRFMATKKPQKIRTNDSDTQLTHLQKLNLKTIQNFQRKY